MSENYEITEDKEIDDQKELAATLAAWIGKEVVVTTMGSPIGQPKLWMVGILKENIHSWGRFSVQTSNPFGDDDMNSFDFTVANVDDAYRSASLARKVANGRTIKVRI